LNGFEASGCADTFKEAVNDLCDAAKKFYPASSFANKRLNREYNKQVMVPISVGG
jgi:hypothetical protein